MTDRVTGASRLFPVLLGLFALSGCSALIYEIVWYQLLQLVIGSTAVSLGVLLATFMGGLCLGSLALPRSRRLAEMHPLRVYAYIEFAIGACGILALIGMPAVDGVYAAAVGHGMPAVLLRALVCALCLLPPTILMGASLPAISRWVEMSPRGVSRLGLLYGGNTAGAVLGSLAAGFYLLRVSDMTTTTLVAAGINALVGIASLALARRAPAEPLQPGEAGVGKSADAARTSAYATSSSQRTVYLAIGLSGASALGAEVVWTRLLGLMLGATVYTFSIILAVFLVGLGIGSAAGALVSRRVDGRTALGVSQLALAAAIAWTAFMIGQSLPNWPVNALLSTSPWFTFQIDLVRVIWARLPPTLLWGASFPLALAAAARPGEEPGRLVGTVYAANTLGAILGALGFSLILIPAIGTAGSNRLLILLAALGGLVALLPQVRASRSVGGTAALTAALALAVYLAVNVGPTPGMLIAYGRRIMTSAPRSTLLYSGEGINSSIAITRWDDGAVQFHVSGKVEASTESYDMRLQRMLGHMPALFHPGPHSVLVVGFGAGVTAGTFVVHPEVQRIVICEMEPLIPPVATRFFGNENFHVATDPRTQIVYDDARHFVLTTPEKFDIITSDPIHPWVKGSATLYSREYFQLVRDHLNPGGVVTQWVPLYESNAETVKSEIATFFNVFPNGTVWANDVDGAGYDIFLLGTAEPMRIDVDKLMERLRRPDYARVLESLRSVGFSSLPGLLSTYAGQAKDLAPWLTGAEINRDGNLRLQYIAGLALNTSQETAIYQQILAYRRPPLNLFTGSPEALEAVLAAMGGGGQSR